MARHAWYNTAAWKARRKEQLRQYPLCKYCADMGRVTPATVADHIKPHRGDSDLFWYGELQSLCAECHSSVKQFEENRGQVKGCDVNGMPLDPDHPWNQQDSGG